MGAFEGEAFSGKALIGEAFLGEALLGEALLGETRVGNTSLYPLSLVLTHALLASATACCNGVVSFFFPRFFPTHTSRSLTIILPPSSP